LLDDLKKALAERGLNAEMDHHMARNGLACWPIRRLNIAAALGEELG